MIPQLNGVIQWWWQWMGSMFWQVSLLILLVTVIDMAIRRWAWPQVRYVLWGLVFLKLVIPPTWQMPTSVVSWLQPRVESQISIQIESSDTDADFLQELEIFEPIQFQDEVASGDKFPFWKTALFLTWFCGMGAFLLVLSIRMARLRKRHRNSGSRHIPDWLHETLSNTAECMKLKKIPAVVFSENGTGPAVYGLFRPVLVLPDGYLEKLSKEQVRHVLLHELCHLKRGDLLAHLCCLTLQAIYWFNPFVFWTRRQMRHVCEICCDLSVANILREKTSAYRSTLLSSARDLFPETASSSLGLLGIFEEPFRLVSRLKWLEKTTWKNRKRKTAAAIFIGLFMIFSVMPMSGLSQPAGRSGDLSIQPNNASGEFDGQYIREESDIDQPMFLIEALIIESESELDSVEEKGVQIRADTETSNIEMKNTVVTVGAHTREIRISIVTDCEFFIRGASFRDVQTATQRLANLSGVKIIAAPKVATFNGSKCTIEMGSIAGPAVSPANQETIGFQLEITPQLLENGGIQQDFLMKVANAYEVSDSTLLQDGDTLFLSPWYEVDETSTTRKSHAIFITTRIIRGKDQLKSMLPEEAQNTPEEKNDIVSMPMLRSWLVNEMEKISDLTTQATFTPFFSKNELIGLRASDITISSVVRQMGIYEDDLLTAVNGLPLATPDQMYDFVNELKTCDTASLERYQDGQASIIQYSIRDDIHTFKAVTTGISLRRHHVDSLPQNLTTVTALATFTPYSVKDLNGLKISEITPNSILRRMGLRNSDILTATNGHPLSRIDQLVDFFEDLKSSDTASLEFYRRGRPRLYEYKITGNETDPVSAEREASLSEEVQNTPEEKDRTSTSYIPMLRSWLVNKMGNISDLMAQSTFTPFSTNDLTGLKVSDIAPDSVLNQIGIYEDDLLTAVNSAPLTTPDQMYEFLEGLKTSDTASLELYREGCAVINQYKMTLTNQGSRTSRITLSRQQFNSAMENLATVRTQITLTPYSEDDMVGMKISDVNDDSLIRRMGIRNDDILTAVDGKPLATIDQFYDFFENLQSSDAASLEIIRKGVVRNYEYRIR
jgi:bla regulator protein BlaR1